MADLPSTDPSPSQSIPENPTQKSNPDIPSPKRKIISASYAVAILLLIVVWSSRIYNIFLLDLLQKWTTRHFECADHGYTTEIVSVDPLLVYINDFVTDEEAKGIVAAGEPNLHTSEIEKGGQKFKDPSRTSQSGALLLDSPIVQCVLSRASIFMGTLLAADSEFSIPQIVRYSAGEKFDTHHDWYGRPEKYKGGWFDRIASFFVYLEDEGVVGGETWFPMIDVGDDVKGKWVKRIGGEEEGGTMFVPRKGNALFWVNLFGNGTGDKRVVHAGLPLKEGRKTAMNLWPRKIYKRGWWEEYPHLVL